VEAATTIDAKADFVAFFDEGWRIGASDPERFFEHFEGRMTEDVELIQPLARRTRGPGQMRQLFAPLFEAIPDLRGEVVRWGPTEDGVIVELPLSSASTGLHWTTVDVIVLRDGNIASRHAHFDPLPLIGQLARRPRLAARLVPHLLKGR
jgi:ketosteroid isomerase-like protein